jgi:hypothetical protein
MTTIHPSRYRADSASFSTVPQPRVAIFEYANDPNAPGATAPVATQTVHIGPGASFSLSAPFGSSTKFITIRANVIAEVFVGRDSDNLSGRIFQIAADGNANFPVQPGWIVGSRAFEAEPVIGRGF